MQGSPAQEVPYTGDPSARQLAKLLDEANTKAAQIAAKLEEAQKHEAAAAEAAAGVVLASDEEAKRKAADAAAAAAANSKAPALGEKPSASRRGC